MCIEKKIPHIIKLHFWSSFLWFPKSTPNINYLDFQTCIHVLNFRKKALFYIWANINHFVAPSCLNFQIFVISQHFIFLKQFYLGTFWSRITNIPNKIRLNSAFFKVFSKNFRVINIIGTNVLASPCFQRYLWFKKIFKENSKQFLWKQGEANTFIPYCLLY